MILEDKMFQVLKLSKNTLTKNVILNYVLILIEKKNQKDLYDS
jgi:hypothetical protein